MAEPVRKSEPTTDDWSHPEIVRALGRIEQTITEVRDDQKKQRTEYVSREVWEQSWAGLADWKAMVVTDVVNLDASLTRHSRDHTQEHAEIRNHIDERVIAERADRVSGQRWALGIGITSILGLIGTLLTMMNQLNGG
jgi:hypothetical protein